MPGINSFTSLEQSKKLAEILPLETADMEYLAIKENGKLIGGGLPFVKDDSEVEDSAYSNTYDRIFCWSLAALLNVLPKGYSLGRRTNGKFYVCMTHIKHNISEFNNPVDSCVEMILKLNELKML